MHSAQASYVAMPSVLYDDWKDQILMATDEGELVRTVRAYLGVWRPQQLSHLPYDLAALALMDSEDIISRAVLASREELKADISGERYHYLRQMALTLACAANRLRFMRAFHGQGPGLQASGESPPPRCRTTG